jgi:hypothetical protein
MAFIEQAVLQAEIELTEARIALDRHYMTSAFCAGDENLNHRKKASVRGVLINAVIVQVGTGPNLSGFAANQELSDLFARLQQKLKFLFLRTRLRRSHSCHTIVDTQLAVNFARMFD